MGTCELGHADCNYTGLIQKLDLISTVTNYFFFRLEWFTKAVNRISIKLQQRVWAGRWNVKQTWNLIYSALLALEMKQVHRWKKHGEVYMHEQV